MMQSNSAGAGATGFGAGAAGACVTAGAWGDAAGADGCAITAPQARRMARTARLRVMGENRRGREMDRADCRFDDAPCKGNCRILSALVPILRLWSGLQAGSEMVRVDA